MAASKQVVAILPDQMQARLTAGACISCGEPFSEKNVFSQAGWAETRISQTCERCFDALFEDEDG